MTNLEKAIEKAFDRITMMGDSADVYAVLYRYKAIRQLPQEQIDEIYDEIAERQGFTE